MTRVGQNHIYTVYIRYFGLGNHQIYGVYIRIYTVLANPKYDQSYLDDYTLKPCDLEITCSHSLAVSCSTGLCV